MKRNERFNVGLDFTRDARLDAPTSIRWHKYRTFT